MKIIDLMFCGGCNCYYDREAVFLEILESLGNEFVFNVMHVGDKPKSDCIIIINGCSSECLMEEVEHKRVVVINNSNYVEANLLVQRCKE